MAKEITTRLDFGAPKMVDGSLSERVRGLIGSEILKIAGDIRELKAAGHTICNLTVGDFDTRQFPIPRVLAEGIARAYDSGETNYPPSDGVLDLRRSIVEFVEREWGARYPIESVLVASGARPILYAAYRCVLNPGDRVIYPVPSWNNNHYCHLVGARGVPVATRPENGFLPTADELAPHLGRQGNANPVYFQNGQRRQQTRYLG